MSETCQHIQSGNFHWDAWNVFPLCIRTTPPAAELYWAEVLILESHKVEEIMLLTTYLLHERDKQHTLDFPIAFSVSFHSSLEPSKTTLIFRLSGSNVAISIPKVFFFFFFNGFMINLIQQPRDQPQRLLDSTVYSLTWNMSLVSVFSSTVSWGCETFSQFSLCCSDWVMYTVLSSCLMIVSSSSFCCWAHPLIFVF